jgi:hypothetical protein
MIGRGGGLKKCWSKDEYDGSTLYKCMLIEWGNPLKKFLKVKGGMRMRDKSGEFI